MTTTVRPPDEVGVVDLDDEVDLAIAVLGHPTAEQDDRLLERIGYPSVAEQERISAAIIAAEQAGVERTWRQQQFWLLTEAERKRGATAEYDSHLGVWVADSRWVVVRTEESAAEYKTWVAKGCNGSPPRADTERADIVAAKAVKAADKPPKTKRDPSLYQLQCGFRRCRKTISRPTRRGVQYCDDRCRQGEYRARKQAALRNSPLPLPGVPGSPIPATQPRNHGAHIASSVTPDPERTPR